VRISHSITSFFFGVGIAFPSHGEVIDRVVAVVGEEAVLSSDIEKLRKDVASSPALANIYRIDPKQNSPKELLDFLLEEKIIKQSLKDLDLSVADSEVENQIGSIARQNNLSRKQLEDSLRQEGIPFEAYRANIRTQLERRNIFEHELRRGGGVSETEVRALYQTRADRELKLLALSGPKTDLEKISRSKAKPEADLKGIRSEDLGWVGAGGLHEKISKKALSASAGEYLGPIDINGRAQLFFVETVRTGSEEEFQKVKPELMAQAQAQDFERRFKFWVERRKKELNILVHI